ncbi:uncharacterized protein LOC118486449 [Helianthus annuus]|uniref:uncharacterized protein LOC118486449 n=1 Tax=Helianthus annuus TaxID=4232 RepID=UPI001652E75D|nr:uncharacterized protein LOC118486449 [Helianthus annuus]
MAQHGFSMYSKLVDAIDGGNWVWPEAWRNLFPVLFQLQPVTLSANVQDRILWMNSEGNLVSFESKEVWAVIRTRGHSVEWSNIVWSRFNIPKHAFISWLILKRKLWTQDRILHWNHTVTGSINQMCCLLCFAGIETIDHLFFECKYSKMVWYKVREKGDMSRVSEKWDDIMQWLVPIATRRSIEAVTNKLLVAASAYFIWMERNARFFNNQLRPPEKIVELILHTVRTKLLSFKYKASANVNRFLEKWNVHGVETFDDHC